MKQVSVIVPCYNEEATICLLLEALCKQTYPSENMEIIIADGLSSDHTRLIINEFKIGNPQLDIRIVDNPLRVIPSGLNRAIEAAKGEYLVRLDAHSIPNVDYIERVVEALDKQRGDNVGGIWKIRPSGPGWIARSIAAAGAHPLGVGDALYRIGAKAQYVDTVPFGAFRRELAIKIGMYDEGMLTNEDYELNSRIRREGRKIWFDPAIQSTYFARSTYSSLAQQYWRYGYWKAQMLRRYPGTIRWRQAIPPLFSASLIVLFIGGIFVSWIWILLGIELIIYSIILIFAGIIAALNQNSPSLIIGLPLAIAIMHITWGTALIWGIIHPTPMLSAGKM